MVSIVAEKRKTLVRSVRWRKLVGAIIGALACSIILALGAPIIQQHIFKLTFGVAPQVYIVLLRVLVLFVPFLLLWFCFLYGFRAIGHIVHRYRFAIGCGIILFAVILNVNGSSLGMWNYWLGHDMSTDVVWGIPRIIRTDEYVVGTPLAFSQSYSGYSYFNDLFGNKPADMFIVKDAPVLALAEIFRPFHWGYILFGSSRGLAFYWSARLVVLFLAAYEFFLCISNDHRQEKHKGVAFVGAILIACAPLVQWWFAVNALPEMLIAIFVSIVCFDRYLGDTETGHRAAYAAVILICAGMFALTLYPAWQISLGYLLAVLILWVVIRHWGQIRVSRKDVVILVGEIALFCVILGSAVMTSWGTIQSMLHTAYPGARQSTGGGLPPLSLISSVGTLFFPFKDYAVDSAATNMVEASRVVDLFPLGIILALFGMIKRKKVDILSVCLIAVIALFSIFACVGVPLWLSKILMLTSVTSGRCVVVLGVANIAILVRAVAITEGGLSWKQSLLAASVFAAVLAWTNHGMYLPYIGRLLVMVCFVIVGLLSFAVLSNGVIARTVVAPIVSIGLLVSGLSVNPVQYGSAPLTKQPLMQQVQSLQTKYQGMWAIDDAFGSQLANLAVANGVHTLNALEVTPDLATWKKLDPNGRWEEIYNRYAFVSVNVVEQEAADVFTLVSPDSFTVHVTPAQLRKLGVNNVLSPQKLDEMQFDGYSFERIGETIDGRTPYRIIQQ